MEAIKHQGGRLDGVAPGDVGKRSVEIVGEAHDMNYKKVMRYLRLNSLVPELLSKVDEKGLGFMKNDIAVAQRLGITATTLEGILTVKGQGRRRNDD